MKKRTQILTKLGLFTFLSILITIASQRLLFFYCKRKSPKFEDSETYLWHGESIAYKTYGTGKPILLLHNTCLGASSREWEKNITALSEKYTVYVPDLPGFGDSQKTKTDYTVYHYALFLNRYIEDVIQQPVNIIASSTSGCFALMAHQLNQNNIQKLILISPTGMEDCPFASEEDTQHKKLLESPILGTGLYLKAASKKALKNQLQQELFFSKEKVTEDLVLDYYLAAHKGGENARYSYACASTKFMNTSIENAISKLEIPFMIIWGENNLSNPSSHLEKLQNLRPDGEYVLFEKTRVLPHFENTVKFNEITREFLG